MTSESPLVILPEPGTRIPFPSVLDSTMMNALRSCPERFQYEYIRRLRPRGGKSIHLIAGGAIASALQTARLAHFRNGCSADDAMALGVSTLLREYGDPLIPEKGSGAAKTWDRVLGCYEAYLDRYPLDRDIYYPLTMNGKPAVEFNFALPLDVRHPESGDPLIFAGRFDMAAGVRRFNYDFSEWEPTGGKLCVDEKTTGRGLGDQWASQWDLRAQFMAYTWAMLEHGIPVEGVVVRGLCILKTEYKFAEKIVYTREWRIDRWLDQTKRDIKRAIALWNEQKWDLNLGDACNSYGGCAFRRLCEVENPEPWIPLYYEPNDWSPLQRTEED